MITSNEVAQVIFGDNYTEYIYWQYNLGNPDQAQFYRSEKEWQTVVESIRMRPKGQIPSPSHFKIFMNWMLQTGNLYTRAVNIPVSKLAAASYCGHLIHPGNSHQDAACCPICVMEQCVESLGRISEAWDLLGGPNVKILGSNFRERKEKALLAQVKRIWKVEKLRWANLIFVYEELAEDELKWEEDERNLSKYAQEELDDCSSCTGALELGRELCPYIIDGDGELIESNDPNEIFQLVDPCLEKLQFPTVAPSSTTPNSPSLCLPQKSSVPEHMDWGQSVMSLPFRPLASHMRPPPPPPYFRQKSCLKYSTEGVNKVKRVAFGEDCVEREYRESMSFLRTSQQYSPGRYSCPSLYGWKDTNFMKAPNNIWWVTSTMQDASAKNLTGQNDPGSNKLNDGVQSSTDLTSMCDLDSDSDDSDATVTATMDDNYGSGSHQMDRFEQYSEEDGFFDDDDEEYDEIAEPVVGDVYITATGDESASTHAVTAMRGNSRTEGADSDEAMKGDFDDGNVDGDKYSTTSLLGRRTRKDFEEGETDQPPSELKRARTEEYHQGVSRTGL